MIHGFYFRFLMITKNEWISVVLAKMAYLCFFIKFLIKKMCLKPCIIKGDAQAALNTISKHHPDPAGRPKIERPIQNPSIDLSIIVPVYNYANLIRENIESILQQKTRYQFELILVDDGSTDGARDILISYENNPRVTVICQENQGIAGARNTGLNHAVGKYIMFVDCDDVVTEDIVETLMGKAYSDDCDIVMCAHERVKEKDGKIIGTVRNIYSSENLLGYCESTKILNYAGLPWCKVFRRELWDNVRFMPGYWFEDTIIHALLFTQCKKFAYVPKVCYRYRWYEGNFSRTQGKRNNVKCIDRYWMLVPILEQAECIGVTESDCFYTMLLNHLSVHYYNTVSGMNDDVVEALFVLACELCKKYRPERNVELPYMKRMVEKALLENDINLWKLAIKYC